MEEGARRAGESAREVEEHSVDPRAELRGVEETTRGRHAGARGAEEGTSAVREEFCCGWGDACRAGERARGVREESC